MANNEGSTEVPAKRAPSRVAAKLREELDETKKKAAARIRAYAQTAEAQDMIGEAEGLAGAAGAGLAEAYGMRVELAEGMDVPSALVIGPAVYIAGRVMGNTHVRKIGFGATCGGLALGVAEWAA